METVSNLTSAASRAIWGDTAKKDDAANDTVGQEPVAGQLGDTTRGEPYDKGNAESSATTTFEPKSLTKTTTREIQPESSSTAATTNFSPTARATEVGCDTSSAPLDTQEQQGANRPTKAPSSLESDKIKDTKYEAEVAAEDTTGPTLNTLNDRSSTGAGADHGPRKETPTSVPGEKYVKSSGVVADGGDFDAANPGAGKEADRLLESQGRHNRDTPSQFNTPAVANDTRVSTGSDGSQSPDSTEGKEKVSLKDKIKAKLHKH